MSPSRGRKSHSSSPKRLGERKPLHERSPSQNNARSLSSRSRPSIRIVEDDAWISQSRMYNKSALPSKPSQILVPGRAQGFSRPGSAVSDLRPSSNASNAASSNEALVPRPLHLHRAARASGSTNFSEDDTLVNTSTTFFNRRSISSATPTSPTFPESILEEKLGAVYAEPEADDSTYSTIRPVISSSPPSTIGHDPSSEENLSVINPETSPAVSLDSLQTLTARNRDDEDDASSTNFEVFATSPYQTPNPSDFRGLQHASSAKRLPKPIFPPPDDTSRQSLTDLSFISSYISIDEPLQSSSPSSNTQDDLRTAIASGLTVQYPTIPSRTSSASYASDFEADSLPDLPNISPSPHMLERPDGGRWASRLSTIHSELEPRAAQSISGQSGNGNRRSNRTAIESMASALQAPPSLPSDTSVPIPPPLFQRNGRAFTPDSQELQESDDTVPELYSPPLRTVRSNRSFFSVFSSAESRPSSATDSVRGSVFERASFMESNFFPAWARSYYRRDSSSLPSTESTTSLSLPFVYSPSPNGSRNNTSILPTTPSGPGRPHSGPSRTPSLDYVPATLHHPRKRPRHQQQQPRNYRPPTTESVVSFAKPERPLPALPQPLGSHAPDAPQQPQGPRPPPKSVRQRPASAVPSQRRSIRSPIHRTASGHFTWTPRLAHDRRSAGALSAWPAPSMVSSMGGVNKLFGKRTNRQIGLFIVGFVFPFAWMVAAFLSLPPKPPDEEGAGSIAGQHAREQAWRQSRSTNLSQLGGLTVVINPEGHGEFVVHNNGEQARGSISTNELGHALDGTQAMDYARARENSAVQMQAVFMQSWFSGELEKTELRRRYAKARWWRMLNRIMAVVGFLVLGAVVALIVVASKYHF